MVAIPSTSVARARIQPLADPFMRKNQIWFQKSLPPAIERQHKKDKPKNNLEQMALHILNPKHIDRRQLSPNNYRQRLSTLQNQLHRSSNQLPQSKAIMDLIHKERELITLFNDNRLTAVPC
jgi:phage FluMu gp28-like protein